MNQPPSIPPNPADEREFLGALLVPPSIVAECPTIPDDAFSETRHVVIYRAARDVFGANPDASGAEFLGWFTERKMLEDVGGESYLSSLIDWAPSRQCAKSAARRILARLNRQKAHDTLLDAAGAVIDTGETSRIAAELQMALGSLCDEAGRTERIAELLPMVVTSIEQATTNAAPIGVHAFDVEFVGIPTVGVTTILGVPASGKSALALQIVRHQATKPDPDPWLILSLEVGASQMVENMLAAEAMVPASDIRRGAARMDQVYAANIRDAAVKLGRAPIEFSEEPMNPSQIAAACAKAATRGIRNFVIDYAQNATPENSQQSEREKLAGVMRVAQAVARRHDARVIVVSQPTLDAGRHDRPLEASDVKGAQEIWAGSDMLISLYRSAAVRGRQAEESDADWNTRRQQCTIRVNKNKNGRIGFVTVHFTPELLRFA